MFTFVLQKPFVINREDFDKKSVDDNLALNNIKLKVKDHDLLMYNKNEYVKRRRMRNRLHLVSMNDLYGKRKLQNTVMTDQPSSTEKQFNEGNTALIIVLLVMTKLNL